MSCGCEEAWRMEELRQLERATQWRTLEIDAAMEDPLTEEQSLIISEFLVEDEDENLVGGLPSEPSALNATLAEAKEYYPFPVETIKATRNTPARFSAADLRNTGSFPNFVTLPWESVMQDLDRRIQTGSEIWMRTWCFLGEIVVAAESTQLYITILVRDRSGRLLPVRIQYEGRRLDDYTPGKSVAILYAAKHRFGNDMLGIKVEDPRFIQSIPCGLEGMLLINEQIENDTPADGHRCCPACKREENIIGLVFQRCGSCEALSYCSTACNQWDNHKAVCRLFRTVYHLKLGHDWRDESHHMIPFSKSQPLRNLNRRLSLWMNPGMRAENTTHQETFTISSGSLLWGQIHCITQGARNVDRGNAQSPYVVAARKGNWKVAKLDGTAGWLAYHERYVKEDILLKAQRCSEFTQNINGEVVMVKKTDWGNHHPDIANTPLALAELEPESEWPATIERNLRLRALGKPVSETHPDYERWRSLEEMKTGTIFLVDAGMGAYVLKAVAKGLGGESRSNRSFVCPLWKVMFGCQLVQASCGQGESARLIFEKRGYEKELIGFWYK